MSNDSSTDEGRNSGPRFLRRRILFSVAVFLVAATVVGGWYWQKPVIYSLEGFTMGSTWSLRVVGPRDLDIDTVKAEIEAEFKDLDQQLSGYREDSALSTLNNAKVGEWVNLPPDLATVLRFGFALNHESGGGFDMTVRPLVLLWGFGPAQPRVSLPSEEEVARAREELGNDEFEISADGRKIRRLGTATIDVDAIAPGLAADVVAAMLNKRGLVNHLVEVGGALRATGTRPDGSGWRVGIEKPEMMRGDVAEVIQGPDTGTSIGISTSGDYRDYFDLAGKRYSHILDPVTGRPVTHALTSVTVIATTTLAANGYDTALMVMGPDKGMAWADAHGLPVYMIVRDNTGGYVERYNRLFEPYLRR